MPLDSTIMARSRSELKPLNPRCALVLEAIKGGAEQIRGVVVWLKIEKRYEFPPGVLASDIRTLQRRGMVVFDGGKWKITESEGRMVGSTKGAKVGKKAKQLTKKEIRESGEFGLFAAHLLRLLEERDMTAKTLSEACKEAKIDIEEYSVRSWLRAESMPKSHQLRAIGRVIGLDDPRHILPE